jgi:cytochrome c553
LNRAIVSTCLTLLALAAHAAGDPESGKTKAAACATCHGEDGKSPMAIYPKLAGQNEPYLAYALKTYRANQRKGSQASLMTAIAVVLSDQDIDDLAAYYAGLKP